jgi:hypothetical protein
MSTTAPIYFLNNPTFFGPSANTEGHPIGGGEYERTLAWLQRREGHGSHSGWPLWQGKHWRIGPPHERAARIVIARLGLHLDWHSFLNRPSSQKRG